MRGPGGSVGRSSRCLYILGSSSSRQCQQVSIPNLYLYTMSTSQYIYPVPLYNVNKSVYLTCTFIQCQQVSIYLTCTFIQCQQISISTGSYKYVHILVSLRNTSFKILVARIPNPVAQKKTDTSHTFFLSASLVSVDTVCRTD